MNCAIHRIPAVLGFTNRIPQARNCSPSSVRTRCTNHFNTCDSRQPALNQISKSHSFGYRVIVASPVTTWSTKHQGLALIFCYCYPTSLISRITLLVFCITHGTQSGQCPKSHNSEMVQVFLYHFKSKRLVIMEFSGEILSTKRNGGFRKWYLSTE